MKLFKVLMADDFLCQHEKSSAYIDAEAVIRAYPTGDNQTGIMLRGDSDELCVEENCECFLGRLKDRLKGEKDD